MTTPLHRRLKARPVTDRHVLDGLDCRAWLWVDIDGNVVGVYGTSSDDSWGFSATNGNWWQARYGNDVSEHIMPTPLSVPIDNKIPTAAWRVEHWFTHLGDRYQAMQAADRAMSIFDSQAAGTES